MFSQDIAESFVKALKWYALVASAIIGTSAFMISSDTGSMKPLMLGVLGYGVVYIMSMFWREFQGKILLFSGIVFLILTFFSRYIPILMYLLFGHEVESYDPYWTWGISMGLIGIPIMTVIFKKYD